MSKVRVVAFALLAAIALAANAAPDRPKAVFVISNMANESQAFAAKQFLKYGADYGFDVQTFDAKGDTQAESQIVTNAIAQKFKAIFVNPNDINAIIPSLMKAKAAGMSWACSRPTCPWHGQKYRDFFAGVNDTMAGQQAADAFKKHFPNGAKIVEIGGQAGHDAQIKRHDGFNAAIKGTKIEVIDYKACTQWATTRRSRSWRT